MARQFLNGIDSTNNRIINVASPTSSTDAANKAYVDALQAGLEWKEEVVVATTTNGTLATAYANGQVVDGVTLATGERILLKNQTTQSQNGIYTVNASGAPTLATDANTSASLNNATVLVTQGTVNANTAWTQTTANPTVGTSNIVFVQFGAGSSYTAGTNGGLQLSSNAFSILLPANSGLQTTSSGESILLGSTPGLTLTGGLAVSLAASSGLNTTSGLAVGAGAGITVSGGTVAVTGYPANAYLASKYVTSIGNGSAQSFTITHGLGSADVVCQVYDNGSLAQVECDVVHTNSTTLTLTFGNVPTSNQYRVVVVG